MRAHVESILIVCISASALVMGLADYFLLRHRPTVSSKSEIGFAPARWYRESKFPAEVRWLTRLARWAFHAFLTLTVLFMIVRLIGALS